jgi:hypothetical protein
VTIASFIRATLPFWSTEFVIILMYSHFGSGEMSVAGVVIMISSMIILPLFTGAKIAAAGGEVMLSILGAVLLSAAGTFAVAVTYFGQHEGFFPFLVYLSAILMVFVIPQAAFGYVGAFAVRYTNALSRTALMSCSSVYARYASRASAGVSSSASSHRIKSPTT